MEKPEIHGLHLDDNGTIVVFHLSDGSERRCQLDAITIERDDHGAAWATIDGERYGGGLASALAAAKGA